MLDAIMPAFVSRKCLSVQLLTQFTICCRRINPANICMQGKRRLARHHQYKASLVEEAPRPDNAVIPDAPPQQPPATQQQPESPSLQPPPEANRAVRRLGIGDQQSAESTPQPALERSTSPAPSHGWQDWQPKDNHYPTPPPAQCKDQTPLRSSEWDSGSDYGEGGPMPQGHLKILRSGSSVHAAGPDLGNTHGLCLATPQHIPPFMNAIGAACEGLQLKQKSHTRCPLTAQAFLECVSLHCDGSFVLDI
jgi:hypothetical protein